MALSQAEKQRWAEIDSVIAEHKKELKAATDHRVLKAFAEEQGWLNKEDFGKYKHSLRKIGVKYDQLREETFEAEDAARVEALESLGEDAPRVRLWSGAVEDQATGSGSFAVVNADDEVVWYGGFYADDRLREAGDLVSAEQSAADKAVWLASKAFAAAGLDSGVVEVYTTCPQLDEEELVAAGARLGVAVEVHVEIENMRAVEMAEAPGYQSWKDADLEELVEQ